jgi:hypothetical protein
MTKDVLTNKEMTSPTHLSWLVKGRYDTQKTSTKLYALIAENPTSITLAIHSIPAQALVAIGFSLWRAVFLGDKTGETGASLTAAYEFLEKMIKDNTIGYTQERAVLEWSFNYYVSNATHRLKILSRRRGWPKFAAEVPVFIDPKERWNWHQEKFAEAVRHFAQQIKTST